MAKQASKPSRETDDNAIFGNGWRSTRPVIVFCLAFEGGALLWAPDSLTRLRD